MQSGADAPLLPPSASGRAALDVAREAARLARDIIRARVATATVTAIKGRGNVVTATDIEAERVVIELLRREYPAHAVLSEETASATESSGWMWVVDPVDGTKNFSRGLPMFAFTIALCHGERPLLGVTTHPITGTEVVAQDRFGCRVDGAPASIGECSRVADAVVAMDLGYDANRARDQLDLARRIWPGMQSLRIPGSAAMGFAGLAAGWWDLYVHADLQPWDLAAGLVIVQEAGGTVVEWTGRPASLRSRAVIAGRESLIEDLLRLAGPRVGE
jgi:fructose-1,6-bisphosphatase/inositol monophosphatase family enzyme